MVWAAACHSIFVFGGLWFSVEWDGVSGGREMSFACFFVVRLDDGLTVLCILD